MLQPASYAVNAFPMRQLDDNMYDMIQASLTRSVKQALVQALRENRDLFRDLFAEVIEDVSLVNAIREGEKTKQVKRDAVMRALRGKR